MKSQSAQTMRFKAQINNRAKALGISPIVAMQSFMFERFLHRLSRSPYKDNFVLKGGVLVSQWFGLDLRTTMDIDTTTVRLPLAEAQRCVEAICAVDAQDEITFVVRGSEPIRKDDIYGGLRVKLAAMLDRINVPFYIDVTTGDEITPKPTDYLFQSAFDEGLSFLVKGYTVETVMAEKLETLLRLGIANTRPKDLYDLYQLGRRSFSSELLGEALSHTARHRGTEYVLEGIAERFNTVRTSGEIAEQWRKYQSDHAFAASVSLEQVFDEIARLLGL